MDPAQAAPGATAHRTARARTIDGTMVAMPCETAVRIEAQQAAEPEVWDFGWPCDPLATRCDVRVRKIKVRTELYLVSIICIVSACAVVTSPCVRHGI